MQPDAATSFRLSPQQERLWSAEDVSRRGSRAVFLLEGPLDEARLRQCLANAAERHEILRTTFQRQAGMRLPLQVVHRELAPAWETGDGPEDEWALEDGPVLRARLVSTAPDRHLFALAAPSVCADAPSLLTLAREVTSLYAGEPVATEPLQYADFAEWQHELLAGDDDEATAGRRFWADEADALGPVVPFLRRPASRGATGTVPVALAPETVTALERSAEAYRVDSAQFVQAAWQTVLARLSGQEEFALAVVGDARGHAELETAIGAFARPLSVRASVPAGGTFAEVVASAAHARREADRWQDYAAPAAADTLPVAFSGSPAFPASTAAGLGVSLWTLDGEVVEAPLELAWTWVEGRRAALVRFDADAFEAQQAERVAQYLSRVLAQAAQAPDDVTDELDLLDEAEIRRLTVAVDETAAEGEPALFTTAFAAAAEAAPTQTAVVDGTGSLTYAELDTRSTQLAHRLRRAGVGPDVVVGLCTDRSVDMVVGLLGIAKAGGAYLPLNFEHPAARLDHQLRETAASVVVSQERVLPHLPAFEGEIVCLDRDRALLDAEPVDAPDPGLGAEHTAYVIYTSGSTGLPKGVAVTHGNLANYVQAIAVRIGADREPLAFGMVTAISTDLGNTAVFPALATGGTLALVPPVVAADGAALAAFVRERPIDVLKITPSHLNALLIGADAGAVLPRRWLVCGGEALSWDLVARVHELGECSILNHYGPTETTIGSCTYAVADGPGPYAPATVPIGTPIANTACYVLDERGRCVPEGVAGELHIGGAGVARGYVGRPEETAERFLADPFAAGTGGRMYATGDVVRRLPDGALEFLGRADDQVKIRGFRVEPAEIEAALRKVAGVEDAIVTVREEAHAERRLVAYAVAPETVTADELRRGAAAWVPEFMVPAAVVRLDSFPRTPSGKIDRQALPDPDEAEAGGRGYVAPRTPTEEALAAIWQNVLGIERVGVEDDFFAIGGHSLLATQIVAQIRSDFSINLPLHALFTSPTVATLSEQVVQLLGEGSDAETADLLAQLESLSDEEAERLLAGESGDLATAGE